MIVISAGIDLRPDADHSILGITFRVKNPNVFVLAIVIANLYGLLRYLFYGVSLRESPSKTKLRLLEEIGEVTPTQGTPDNLLIDDANTTLRFGTRYVVATEKTSSVTSIMDQWVSSYPKIGKHKAGYSKSVVPLDSQTELYQLFVPWQCQIASHVQTIDHWLPVVSNSVALIWFAGASP